MMIPSGSSTRIFLIAFLFALATHLTKAFPSRFDDYGNSIDPSIDVPLEIAIYAIGYEQYLLRVTRRLPEDFIDLRLPWTSYMPIPSWRGTGTNTAAGSNMILIGEERFQRRHYVDMVFVPGGRMRHERNFIHRDSEIQCVLTVDDDGYEEGWRPVGRRFGFEEEVPINDAADGIKCFSWIRGRAQVGQDSVAEKWWNAYLDLKIGI